MSDPININNIPGLLPMVGSKVETGDPAASQVADELQKAIQNQLKDGPLVVYLESEEQQQESGLPERDSLANSDFHIRYADDDSDIV